MKKKTIWITSAVAGTVLVLGGAGIAVAVGDPFETDDALSGSTLERASSAALDEVGSGTVTDTESSDDAGHTYEVEITLENGDEVDVELDESFDVVRVDGDTTGDTTGPSTGSDASTGSDTSADDSAPGAASSAALPPLTEEDTAAASAAALAAVPAGTPGAPGIVTEVERSDDLDHAYEVEITLENGQDVDVDLDETFAVVSVDGVPAA
jgi:uncharacterized membrane protein YkoI